MIHVSDLSASPGQDAAITAPAPATRRCSLVRLGGGLFAAAGGTFLLAAPPALAGARRDRDHDRAREALERGEALPLAEVLARVRPELGGEVVGVSFERGRGGRWVYEFKVIGRAGRLVEVHVDAATARVLKRETE